MKFPKSERLCNKTILEKLFKEGQAQFSYPFRILYLPHNQPISNPPQVVITISKRNFKKAVDRNWIKRRIREAYRLHKAQLINTENQFSVAYLAIIYIAKEKISYQEIEKKLIRLLARLQ